MTSITLPLPVVEEVRKALAYASGAIQGWTNAADFPPRTAAKARAQIDEALTQLNRAIEQGGGASDDDLIAVPRSVLGASNHIIRRSAHADSNTARTMQDLAMSDAATPRKVASSAAPAVPSDTAERVIEAARVAVLDFSSDQAVRERYKLRQLSEWETAEVHVGKLSALAAALRAHAAKEGR